MTILKNGADVPQPLVMTTSLCLSELLSNHPIAFYELTMSARDPQHQLFGNTAEVLQQFKMINGVSPEGTAQHFDAVRDVVLSAVVGEGMGMRLENPVAS